jgi:hypothetical protein
MSTWRRAARSSRSTAGPPLTPRSGSPGIHDKATAAYPSTTATSDSGAGTANGSPARPSSLSNPTRRSITGRLPGARLMRTIRLPARLRRHAQPRTPATPSRSPGRAATHWRPPAPIAHPAGPGRAPSPDRCPPPAQYAAPATKTSMPAKATRCQPPADPGRPTCTGTTARRSRRTRRTTAQRAPN